MKLTNLFQPIFVTKISNCTKRSFSKQTKITLNSFLAWKKRKLKQKAEQAVKDEEKRRNDYKAGHQVGISGREMFSFNPLLAAGDGIDDGDEAFASYELSDDEESGGIEYRELNMDELLYDAIEADTEGITVAKDDRLKDHATPQTNGETTGKAKKNAQLTDCVETKHL